MQVTNSETWLPMQIQIVATTCRDNAVLSPHLQRFQKLAAGLGDFANPLVEDLLIRLRWLWKPLILRTNSQRSGIQLLRCHDFTGPACSTLMLRHIRPSPSNDDTDKRVRPTSRPPFRRYFAALRRCRRKSPRRTRSTWRRTRRDFRCAPGDRTRRHPPQSRSQFSPSNSTLTHDAEFRNRRTWPSGWRARRESSSRSSSARYRKKR